MNKFFNVLAIAMIVTVIVGCSKSPLTQMDLDAGKEQAKAVEECFKARKIDYSKVPKNSVGYVVMSKQFSDTILAVTGNEPCKSTNMFDVQIAEVQSKNRVVEKAVGVGGDVLTMGIGVAGAVKIVDSISDSTGIKVTGDGNNVSTASEQARIGGSSFANDKSVTGDQSHNTESNPVSDDTSHNTETTSTSSENDSRNTNK